MMLFSAKDFLDALADSKVSHLQLRASRQPIAEMLGHINAVIAGQSEVERQNVFSQRKHLIAYTWDHLSHILFSELQVQNCYMVWPKRAYDIEMLAENGCELISESIRLKLTDMELYDIGQAARCLAFEVPTAALFHMFRAADSAIRRWYKQVTGQEPALKMRSWGAYVRTLRGLKANEKILSAIEQIKDLHRNPVIHPDSKISVEEALSFVGIAESLISGVVSDIERRASGEPKAALANVGPALPLGLALLGQPS
jgi:hypothetical protein